MDRARRALSDAERAYDRGEISAGALDDYKGMLAMATANFVQAELAAAQALAAAAATAGSSAGTGFYVSGNAQVTETRTEQNDNFAIWQGSTLSAAYMSINADVASIIGSDITAGRLDLNADSILLGAGTNTQSSSFEQDSRNMSVGGSSSGAGSWNASVGYNEASSSSEATQYVNTHINVGHLSSTSDELTLRGAVVTANTADITTGTLTVESLQDTHKSENSSMGVNLGVGAGIDSVGKPQSGSGGANFAKGDSEGAITGEQTAILIGNGADSQITANHTNLIGGMIANASWEIPEGADENAAPVLVDHGQLNFTTDTLTVSDLRDYSRSSQTGGGIQTNFGLGVYDGTDEQLKERGSTHLKGEEYVTGSTTVSLQSEGHRMEGQTLATIGGGNIRVGGVSLDQHQDYQDLNRDVEQAQIVTLEQQTGALNGSMSVDHRLFSEAGRQVITDQHIDLKDNFKVTVGGLAGDVARVGTTAASVIEISQLGGGLERIDEAQHFNYREDGKAAARLEAFRDGKIEDAIAAQELLNTLDGVLNDGNGSRVQVTDGAFNPDGNLVAGAANVGTNTLYADMGEHARGSIINTLAHEGMHLSGAGEWMAGVTGYLADFTYRVNAWANSSAISSHGPIYIPVQDGFVHQNLLSQNMGRFATDAVNESLKYRQLNKTEFDFLLDPDRVNRFAAATGQSEKDARRELVSSAAAAMDASWSQALEGNEANTFRAREFLVSEVQGLDSSLFEVTDYQFQQSRIGLKEMMADPQTIGVVLDNLAQVDPARYRSDPAYRAEILQAQAAGSTAGMEAIATAPLHIPEFLSGMAGWTMYAIVQPEQALDQVGGALSGAWEDFQYKGYDDTLRIMQGDVYGVEFDRAAFSTEFGIGLGVGGSFSRFGLLGRTPDGEVYVTNSARAANSEIAGPYLELGSKEAVAAQRVYQQSLNSQEVLVIGRLDDTAAGEQLGMRRLNDPDWTENVNDAWVQGGIDGAKPFYLGSNISIQNLRSGSPLYPKTVFFRELQQLKSAGYFKLGDWMLSPQKQ